MRHVHIIRLVTLACLLISLGALLAVGRVGSADAHPLSTTAVLLTVADDEVTGEIQLPIDRLAIAVGHDLDAASVLQRAELERLRTYVSDHVSARSANGGDWAVVVAGGTVADIDDVDHLVYTLTMAPATGVVTDFTLHYDAIVEELVSHRIFVSERTAGATAYTSLGGLSWSQKSLRVPAGGASASTGFGSSVRLGIDHISGGADHLMFLLMLLLPAPLIASRARWVRSADTKRSWWRVVHVVTAFAIGHSITLALASFGLVDVPTRFVESMIALSILVSGVHAIRPLVPGGESWIAGGFGLMHGLAFAALIDDLGLGRGSLVANLLGFNLGIELTQLMVVALVMPSIIVLNRTRVYAGVRVAIAGVGVIFAGAWLAERTAVLSSNPLNEVADLLVEHPFLVAGTIAALAIGSWTIPALRAPITRETVRT